MLPVTFGTHKKQKQCFCPAPSVRGWFRNHWRKSFGGRFRNTRTAAGFEPMPSKTQPDKMLPVTFGTHKKQFFCPAPSVRGWFPNHWRKTLGGGDPTKCLAHAKQNPAPQNASPYLWSRLTPVLLSGTLAADVVPTPLAQVVWRPVPKHPNSSRIRAHAKQNAARQNASRYLWNP